MAKRKNKYLIVCYAENEMRFEGVFLTTRHAAKCMLPDLKPQTGQSYISSYLNNNRHDCHGLIFVRYDVSDAPIKTHEIRDEAQPLAEKRLRQARLKTHLSDEAIEKLTTDEIDLLFDRLFNDSKNE